MYLFFEKIISQKILGSIKRVFSPTWVKIYTHTGSICLPVNKKAPE